MAGLLHKTLDCPFPGQSCGSLGKGADTRKRVQPRVSMREASEASHHSWTSVVHSGKWEDGNTHSCWDLSEPGPAKAKWLL